MKARLRNAALGLAGLGALLAAWQALTMAGLFHPGLLPSPLKVAAALAAFASDGSLARDVAASVSRVCFGFLISLCLAAPLGFVLGLSPVAKLVLGPALHLLRPIPPIAWIPLAILWFGIGDGPAYFLTMMASFFPIFVGCVAGVESVDRRHIDVARSFGASPFFAFRQVVLPAALPLVLTGCRVGFGVAWMAVIAAELVASHSGLGYLIRTSQDMLRADQAMAGMAAIGLLGLAFDSLFALLRKKLFRWSPA